MELRERSLIIKPCENPATETIVINVISLSLSLPLTSSSHLFSPLVQDRKRESKRERVHRKNWNRMVIRRMDTLGPRSLTPARDSITPACLVGVYRCGGRAIYPTIPGAGKQAGVRVGWEGMHSPGTSTHYMHDGCETPLHAHTHTHTRSMLSQDQSDIQ